jgi:hypothetical protein
VAQVYANAVGPVTNNIFINNRLYDNRVYGLTVGGAKTKRLFVGASSI